MSYETPEDFATRVELLKAQFADQLDALNDQVKRAFAERMKQPAPEPEKDRAREIAERMVIPSPCNFKGSFFIRDHDGPRGTSVKTFSAVDNVDFEIEFIRMVVASALRAHGDARAAEMLERCINQAERESLKMKTDGRQQGASFVLDALRDLLPGDGKGGAK